MISASTWFDPYVLEVLEIPIVIILGTLSAWLTKKAVVGPFVHGILSVLFYLWIWVYFYSSNSSEFFAIHMNDFESYIIEMIFLGVTWLLSWSVLKTKKNNSTNGCFSKKMTVK
ncbi:hypothetical protein ACDZ29_27705 (plasmid) [Peribacillus sp. RS7]|uniref:hypothetical protein n=1 Tax=Peribacillus sp. RS7 TaxID=3242679 RepID=UPI0035BF0075